MARRRRIAPLARVALIGILLAGCAVDVRAATIGPVEDAAAAAATFTCEVMGTMSPATPSSEASTPDD